jgi:hypothetical protein
MDGRMMLDGSSSEAMEGVCQEEDATTNAAAAAATLKPRSLRDEYLFVPTGFRR